MKSRSNQTLDTRLYGKYILIFKYFYFLYRLFFGIKIAGYVVQIVNYYFGRHYITLSYTKDKINLKIFLICF